MNEKKELMAAMQRQMEIDAQTDKVVQGPIPYNEFLALFYRFKSLRVVA